MIVDKQVIKNWRGRIIGYIETDHNGNKLVKDFYRKIVGRYDKKNDVTRDFYGRMIARGDQCSLLLSDSLKKQQN